MTTTCEELIADIEALDGCPKTKEKVIALLCVQYAGLRVSLSPRAQQRRARDSLMANLRKAGYGPQDQVRVLAKRLGVNRTTAWRWVRHSADP